MSKTLPAVPISSPKELLVENNPFFLVLKRMHDGVLIGDTDTNVMWFNKSLKKALNLHSHHEGKPTAEVIDSDELNKQIRRVLKKGSNVSFELTLKDNNYKKVFQVDIVPLTDGRTADAKALSGFVVLFHNLTHAKRIEKMRRDFVANVSHELRTPLTAIRGYAETLLDGALEDTDVASNFVEIIFSHSKRLSQLVADLLDLSKLESPDFSPELEPTDLQPIIRRAQSVITDTIELKQLSLAVDIPVDTPTILANTSNIEQVFTNLLDNATKYTPEGGDVSLSIEKQDDKFVLVKISDTGIGIAPKHVSRLFERFYRVDKARSRDMGGTGLGLSIVKHIIQYHGGDIWVESEVDKGTTFFFTLQIAPAQ